MPAEDFQEMQSLPTFIKEHTNPEPFQKVVERIKNRLIQTPVLDQPNVDEDGVDKFLKDPKIWKSWAPPSTSEIAQFTAELEEPTETNQEISDETTDSIQPTSAIRPRTSENEITTLIPTSSNTRARKPKKKISATPQQLKKQKKRQNSTCPETNVPKKRGRPAKVKS